MIKYHVGIIFFILAWLSIAAAAPPVPESAEAVIPGVAAAPRLDGVLDDDCWGGAARLTGFAAPGKFAAAEKPVVVLLAYTDDALYVGATCAEPRPERIKSLARQGMRSVWQDDCLEIFLRTGESALDVDQFIVNSAGVRQAERIRAGRYEPAFAPAWEAAGRVDAAEWTVEAAIPFAVLVVETPQPGTMFQLALGREDHTGGEPVLTNWPQGAAYGAMGGYGRIYFGTANHLRNPDMAQQGPNGPTDWSFGADGKDRELFSSEVEGDEAVIVLQSPNRYATASQSLKLRPQTWYRLEAWVKGEASVNLRARTSPVAGQPTVPYDVTARPSPEYRKVEVRFPSGETGEALIIIGSLEGYGEGEVRIAQLRVVQDVNMEADGPAIPIAAAGRTVVKKLLVSDCRVVRGFVTSPVDGRLRSYDWDVNVWEYGMAGAGAGVGYAYRNNDGLHITLADREGVDAVQIRRGAAVKLYADAERYDDPGSAPLVWEFHGRAESSRALFQERVRSDRFSFFNRTDGLIADVSFFRMGGTVKGRPDTTLGVGGPGAFGELAAVAEDRFPEQDRAVFGLGAGLTGTLAVEKGRSAHLLTEPLAAETPLDAIGVQLTLAGLPDLCPATIAVQDPLEPRAELMGVDVTLQGGSGEVVLDFPDQVVPAGRRLWLTLSFGAPVTVEGLQVKLHRLTREEAVPEALAYRKLQMRGLFCQLSEARQWMTLNRNTDLEQFYRENHWGPAIRELTEALAHCKDLGPNDDLVRCYDEWIWARSRDLPPFEPRIDESPGAPEWAVLARQAWLQSRAVAEWWLDNRLVPTGELGGLVGDDSDFYQNLADLPMLENDGVGARCKQAAALLAELAEQTTLENGLNKHTMDPLHAYEEGLNHEALMLWWNYGDPVYFERCLLAAKNLPALTVVTEQGHRHFRNQDCGAEDLRIERPLGVDGDCHPLMWHPALEVAWYNRSPAVLRYLDEWARGWLAHNRPGEYAYSVDVATETVTSKGERPLYAGYGGQGSAHGFLYQITGDPTYLQPYLDGFAQGQAVYPANRFIPELWQAGFLDNLSPDALAGVAGRNPVAQALIAGDRRPLLEALRADIAELQRFWPMYTTAEVFTDRIFLDRLERATTCYTGGFATRNKYNHTHAVSWEGFGTDYAAFVLEARSDRFRALLYNFRDEPAVGQARFWTLSHGRYRVTLGPDGDDDGRADSLAREEVAEVARATALPVVLPSRQVVVLELTQEEELDDIRLRPDLAVATRELRVADGPVVGIVHNIGGGDAPAFRVTLLDAGGQVRATADVGLLAAPVDLEPKRAEFRLTLPEGDTGGWRVVVDAEHAVPELYEGNNATPVP
ncbi:MAG: hypothetical protein HPY69_00960 [Armatimonadetes bacterium]|nr:hypothetical protein [Armatimonadota bacterium]